LQQIRAMLDWPSPPSIPLLCKYKLIYNTVVN
jgi:hypothetical protein